MACFETFTQVLQTLICDIPAPVSKSTNSSYKSHLHSHFEIDGFQNIEYFQSFANVVQALICDSVARPKVEIDGLQSIEFFESFAEALQTFICDVVAAIIKSTNPSYKTH